MQAFDVLERLDPSPQLYEAKRGAAVGTFQMVVAGKEEVREWAGCCLTTVCFGAVVWIVE